MRGFKMRVWILSAVLLLVLWAVPSALAEETPRYGGILKVAIAGDPPSLDIHQERTFKVQIPMMACYNTLLHYTPGKFPEISCDLCTGWTVSDDHLTYTFTLHQGVTFHDGSELTAADVKISWDKMIWPDKVFPGKRVIATHKAFYIDMVDRIEAPERYTVVFSSQTAIRVVPPPVGSPRPADLCQKISGSGSALLQTKGDGHGSLQIQAIRARLLPGTRA